MFRYRRECAQHVKIWRYSDSQRDVSGLRCCFKRTARRVHTENWRMRIGEDLRGTVKAEPVQRRVKEYKDKAAERSTKRTKSSPEEALTDAPPTPTTNNQQSITNMTQQHTTTLNNTQQPLPELVHRYLLASAHHSVRCFVSSLVLSTKIHFYFGFGLSSSLSLQSTRQ